MEQLQKLIDEYVKWTQENRMAGKKIAVYLGVSIDYLLGLDPHAATADIRREIALELEPLNEDALERILDYVRFTVAQQSRRRPSPPPLPPEVD